MVKSYLDSYVCLCSKVKKIKLTNYLIKNKTASIEKVFHDLNIGNKCSACRLEIENEYLYPNLENIKQKIDNTKINLFSKIRNKFDLTSLYIKKKIFKQVAPIFSGQNVSTNLIVSNYSIGNFKKYVVPFTVEFTVRDSEGIKVKKMKVTVNPESRLDIRLNDYLYKNSNDLFPAGSVWVKLCGNKKGFIGVTRPHIRITTSSSISSIHMQHGRTKPGSYFTNIDKNENHYLSIVNQENKTNNFPIYIERKYEKNLKFNFSLLPYASRLINLSNLKDRAKVKGKKIFFKFNHYGILRRNILIQDTKNNVISIDHI